QPATAPHQNWGGFGPSTIAGSSYLQMGIFRLDSGLYRTTDNGRNWEQISSLPRNDYQAVAFADEKRGCVVGEAGRVAVTNDGGQTWQEQTLGKEGNFTQVQFVSPEVGWILPHRGHNGGIFATADGGKTWTTQYVGVVSYRPMECLWFLNAREGFLMAG